MAKFSELRKEALKDRKPTEPYVIDDVKPPIKITPPTDLERSVAMAELIGPGGEFETRHARRILEVICGDAFDAVWELCRQEHISVMTGLVSDLLAHFKDDIDAEAANVPGGSGASSS